MMVVYTHLGLGDHIICNGLLRDLARRHGRVFTFVKPHNYESVRAMTAGANINAIVAGDAEAMELLSWMVPQGFKVIGHTHLDRSLGFDKSFYQNAGLPFERRWIGFDGIRSKMRESDLIDKIKLPSEFVFVHDDVSRGYVIDDSQVTQLPVVRPLPGLTANIFDWMGVIERAKSVHLIESSFAFMVDSFPFMDKEIVLHRYVRKLDYGCVPTYRLPWEIIE
jgi:hypothetical protein